MKDEDPLAHLSPEARERIRLACEKFAKRLHRKGMSIESVDRETNTITITVDADKKPAKTPR